MHPHPHGSEPACPEDLVVGEVLVVDDDALIRSLVAEWLSDAGYPVREALDGEAALSVLRARPVALVVTDMHMPRLDGSQVLLVLRRDYAGLPVIAMSGHFRSGRGTSPEAALRLGARRVLAKPFSRAELLEAVLELIGPPGNS